MKKIIYVEDDKDTAHAVEDILQTAGYDVDLAFSPKECFSEIRKKTYDLVLLDIMLPEMSGWDLFQKLKNKKMKFAFISALPISEERRRELKGSGISDYITKPFSKKEIIARVGRILGGK